MAQSVDVGSVLGGRYKVTARVLVSGEQDAVLDGIDQVLNRPVSILVAGPDNGAHLTQGAREVATGERHANLQILDLGTSEGTTYLIANQSPAAELLDLVVPTAPYEEPFFTDTLGQEIFGMPRPEAPASYRQYDYVYEDDSPVEPESRPEPAPPAAQPASRPQAVSGTGAASPAAGQSRPQPKAPAGRAAGAAAGAAAAGAAAAGAASAASAASAGAGAGSKSPKAPAGAGSAPSAPQGPPTIIPTTAVASAAYTPPSMAQVPAAPAPRTAPQPAQDLKTQAQQAADRAPAPRPAAKAAEPSTSKVTLWSEDDYGTDEPAAAAGGTAAAEAAPLGAAGAPGDRKASHFPASARQASVGFDEEETDYDDDEENAPKTGGRWLVGGLVAVLVVAALIFAVTTISGGGKPAAGPTAQPTQVQTPAAPSASGTASAQPPAAPVVAPVITGVTRLVPDAPDMGSEYDGKLPATFDGNPGTFWQTLEYSNANFAGLTKNVNLVVQLKQSSDIKTVTLSQLGGTGGSFKLLTNDQPTLDGAKDIGTGSFTGPSITLPAPQGTKAPYVIISFTQLPRQQSFQTYPYAVKVAEISIK